MQLEDLTINVRERGREGAREKDRDIERQKGRKGARLRGSAPTSSPPRRGTISPLTRVRPWLSRGARPVAFRFAARPKPALIGQEVSRPSGRAMALCGQPD